MGKGLKIYPTKPDYKVLLTSVGSAREDPGARRSRRFDQTFSENLIKQKS
jgi:hypothetical protein